MNPTSLFFSAKPPYLSTKPGIPRFGAIAFPIEPCQPQDILPMLEMTNDVEYLVSGTRYTMQSLQKVAQVVQQRIENGKMEMLVVKDKGRIIASACIDEDGAQPNTAKLSTIYVRPEYQKQGIGETLTQLLIDKAKQRGYARAVLSVHNPVAIRLYEKLGFRPTGIDHHGDITMELKCKSE